jgi:general secretion pathway protein D
VRPGALSVLEAPVKVSADDTTNSLLVTSSPRDFAAIKAVIDRLDIAKRQVYIEAVVMDVSATRGLDLGVAWHGGGVEQNALGANKDAFAYGGFRAANSALPPNPTDLQAFALGVQGPEIPLPFPIGIGQTSITKIPSLGAFITAAATTSGTDILSTPSIVASDNTAAELKVQLNTSATPHAPPASIIAGGIGVPAPPSPTAGRLTIGPRIKVTPHLNDSDEVRIDVEEVISDVASAPDKSDVYGSISFIERAASTTTTVKDGETVVIAGLVRNKSTRVESKVPLLGDIPLLGVLFRTSSETTEKSNLVLVMTPHIIRDQSDMRRIVERVEQERQDMIDHEVIFGETWKPSIDYAHAHGLLFRMRKETRIVKEKERLEQMRAPRDVKEHGGTAPIDLPTPPPTWSGGNPAPPAAPARPAVDKVER